MLGELLQTTAGKWITPGLSVGWWAMMSPAMSVGLSVGRS